ncbi:MAG: elongation factor G-like protein EF-G2 [Kineosporiaceae bacterium]
MANKRRNPGNGGGRVATVDDPSRIRNVVLVGPPGSGKTALIDALLAGAGAGSREPAPARHEATVALAVRPLVHRDVKVNLLDTPGSPDFVGEQRAGLRAADAALVVVSAADGVDAATRAVWEECEAVGMPRIVVLSRLDHPRAEPAAALDACRTAFGDAVLAMALPGPDGGPPVDLLGGDPAGEAARVARAELIEGVIGESEDESLMDRYLAGEPLDEATLVADLETAVARGHFHPVLPVCAHTGAGLPQLLDTLVRALPSPLEHAVPPVTDLAGRPRTAVTADPRGSLVAEVVRTSVDPYLGRVSLVRVFAGTLRPDTPVHVSGHGLGGRGHEDHDADERVGHVHVPVGDALDDVPFAVAGDVCAVTKLRSAETGDTLSDPADPVLMAPWTMPDPLLPVAVAPRGRNDEDALVRALSRAVAADPALRLERDAETHQTVLWCMGEGHAEVVLGRLRDAGAAVEVEEVLVAPRATVARPARGHGRHVKQSGGHGQYAVCDVEVEPLPRGAGVEFGHRIVGGAIPAAFVASVGKGVRAQLAEGLGEAVAGSVAAGAPVIDVRVTLVDGRTHSVDSSDAAFQTAGALAVKDAAAQAGVVLLERLDEVEVTVPDDQLGAVLGDLSGRRGRVLGTDSGGRGRTTVRAEVPATELARYVVELRGLTAGTGALRRCFARYDTLSRQPAR